MITIQAIIFILGSIGFIFLSRNAFKNLRSHGFPRFFAFEALLGLVILNAPYWFVQPFALRQIISWALLLDTIFLAVHTFWAIHRFGAIDRSILDANQVGFEKTTRLVNEGPYRWIRHPMYASLLLFSWGAFLKQVNLTSFLLATIASLTLFLAAVYEEQENLQKFNGEYLAYMKVTRRFIPYIF